MQPFMQLPINLPGNEGEDPKEVMADILPQEIACMYPGYHFGTFVYLKCGTILLSGRTPDEIKANIAAYWKAVSKMAKGSDILTFQ